MVDWAKRVGKAAGTLLHPGEEILGAAQLTPTPFAVTGGGMTGGMIVGGVLGAAVGAARDKRQEKKTAAEDESRSLPDASGREPRFTLPKNGALVGVTLHRLLVFGFSGMGKATDLIHEIPIGDLESVAWQQLDSRLARGTPSSRLVWLSTRDGKVVAGAMISAGPAGKANDTLFASLDRVRPGIVAEYSG